MNEKTISRIEHQLAPIWNTLPKTEEGNVERRSLRYVIHTYFNRRWSIHIRGFEPSRPANATGWGSDDILAQRVPAFVETVLESKHMLVRGFTLNDAAYIVATIDQLMHDWEGALLEQVFRDYGMSLSRSLSYHELARVLEAYVVSWLLRADADTVFELLSNRSLLELSIPRWSEVGQYIRGNIKSLEHKRRWAPVESIQDGLARRGHNAFASQFTFEDAHRIIGSIRQSFAGFWDSECASMKTTLFEMDAHRTGRVPLSRFYGTGMEADWRFGESEAYLRELGALDETSWRGKQVIISNYMQGASNCVVSTPHYFVCCINDCEPLLDEIEIAIGSPRADPQKLIDVVSSMTAQSTLDDDLPPRLKGTMREQLKHIAAVHNGEVPLHGRLFAQWLHYAFPRECAFPHKVGMVTSTPPSEYGEHFYASVKEMTTHVTAANISNISAFGKDELEKMEWMSQWSPEEELIAEHGIVVRAPWEQRGALALVGVLSLCAIFMLYSRTPVSKVGDTLRVPVSKQHYV